MKNASWQFKMVTLPKSGYNCHTRGPSDQLIIAYKSAFADKMGPVALYFMESCQPATAIVLQQDRDGIQLIIENERCWI